MMRMRSSQERVSLSALILCFRAEKMTFTGPNSICCVDRNVEKKNREQSRKNPVHRAPPIDGTWLSIDGTWLSASNKKPAGNPSPAGYPGSEIDGIDDPGHASRG